MNYILDTHSIIWFLNGSSQLSEKSRITIESSDNQKFISIGTVWELAIKISIGKFEFQSGLNGFVDLVEENGFDILPLSHFDLIHLTNLPFIHRDPFDRLLIAQAMENKMTIITKDEHISKYTISTLW